MRTVILHYHIYKNSGTSFDHVLSHNFGDRHELFDGPYPFFVIDQEQLDRIIMRKPEAIAFSSHQIGLPQPVSIDYQALAAIFVRNPFLRIASIYRFKRGPGPIPAAAGTTARPDLAEPAQTVPIDSVELDMTSTAIAARERDFAGWLDYCFGERSEIGNISNAQTRFFSSAYRLRPAQARNRDGMVYDLRTALRTLCGVELLGRTEHFEADVERFSSILADYGIPLTLPEETRHNVTGGSGASVAERVDELLSSLPPGLRDRLIAANRMDLALYDRACELIERDHRP